MANKIPCEIIQDLLPSYMDGLTNEVTNDAVEAHVENCEGCRNALYAMKTPIESEAELEEKQKEQQEEKQEIDFLKKSRKRNKRIAIGSVIAAVVIVFVAIFANRFLISDTVDPNTISASVAVSGNTFRLVGDLRNPEKKIASIQFDEGNGVVTIWFKNTYVFPKILADDSFDFTYECDEPIKQIKVGDRIIWDNGIEISALTSRLYQTNHDYVGDMSANNESANALLVFENFDYINELQTTQEPYGWTFVLTEAPVASGAELEKKMEGYAYALMAVVGNLGVVTFETADGTVMASFNTEDATIEMGKDIKTYGESPANLQVLMEHVGLVSERYADELSDFTISYIE